MPRKRNLCCGYSLRGGTTAIGYSDILVQAVGLVIYVIALLTHSEKLLCILQEYDKIHNTDTAHICYPPPGNVNCSEVVGNTTEYHEIAAIVTGSGGVLIRVVELIIALLLVKGARTRNERNVHLWVVLSMVLLILDSGNFIGTTIFLEQDKLIMTYAIPSLLYKFYGVGVAKSLDRELRMYQSTTSSDQGPLYTGE